MSGTRGMPAMVRSVVALTVICFVAACCLVGAHALTAPIIAEQTAAAKNAASRAVLPGSDSFTMVEGQQDVLNAHGGIDVYRADNGAGLVITVQSKGFGGAVELLVGFDPDGTVTGVMALEHSETAGVGTKALEEKYLAGYVGQSGDVAVDAVSGATVTSKAVRAAVQQAVAIFAEVREGTV